MPSASTTSSDASPTPSTAGGPPSVDDRSGTTPDAEVLELAARLRLSATRIARRLRREADVDLTPTMASAIAAIDVHGPLTLGALADHERVSPPTVTKIVGKLEARGLVARQVDPLDRRVNRVECTPEGTALIEHSRQRKTEWLAARLDTLDESARARLLDAIDVLEELATGGPT